MLQRARQSSTSSARRTWSRQRPAIPGRHDAPGLANQVSTIAEISGDARRFAGHRLRHDVALDRAVVQADLGGTFQRSLERIDGRPCARDIEGNVAAASR